MAGIESTRRGILATIMALSLLAGFVLPVHASTHASGAGNVALRFAVFGDMEPKPDPVFPGTEGAVKQINKMTDATRLNFVLGVGDTAHSGTEEQYRGLLPVMQRLKIPFYPAIGNEEYGDKAKKARFLKNVNLWNEGLNVDKITSLRYVLEFDNVAVVIAEQDVGGKDFTDDGIDWVLEQMRRLRSKPIMLVMHTAQKGAYLDGKSRGCTNPRFIQEVLTQPNLGAVISGHLHLHMDYCEHSKRIGNVHYLHIPGLERTKVPPDRGHIPMFRVFTVYTDHQVVVDTYEVGVDEPLKRHAYRFTLPGIEPSKGE